MSELEAIERIGTDAVRTLRKHKLSSGRTFMINSKDLPSKQSYLEYPDRSIHIVTLSGDAHSFVTIKVLNNIETDQVRAKYSLF